METDEEGGATALALKFPFLHPESSSTPIIHSRKVVHADSNKQTSQAQDGAIQCDGAVEEDGQP